jgi:cytoskeletal protein RodZ
MLTAALSASRRSKFLFAALAGCVALSLGLSGCAGVVSPAGGETTSNPSSGSLSISNVQTSSATTSSVQLSWATNVPSTSAIDYGTTSAYGVSTPVSGAMVMAHQMSLTGLSQQTTYHFRVRSTTGSDTATSPDQTFSTTGNTNSAPTVSVTSPASGATLSGKVNLTAVASDSGTLTGVQFRVDGANVGPVLPTDPFIYVLDSSTLSNGSHTISRKFDD